ncbi:hypothetical protein NQ317_012389 [Molorchus minor]|uniref:Uncharacterized protein n=1 Tax=Molorchus minor TaxID=1323400 RepID=A0ABQ9IRP4_9CUCU|nr:hypothetical protein NQ317_012389 [Molorchus minor]
MTMNQICRTCKCISPHMRSVFEGYEGPHHSPRIDEMLMACASVQVMCGDGLPNQICQGCVEQLRSSFLFKRQCEKIDASLREYAKNVQVNEIKEELQNSDFMESLNTLNNLLNEQHTSSNKDSPSSSSQDVPMVAPKIETDYIQFMDNNQMLLTCRECAKIFTTLEGLRCHKRIHSGGMYKCKQCNKEYTRLNHLQRHEQTHGRRKVHVCRICSKTLTRMEHLKRHLVTHLREKPFSCKTCNRGFNRVEHLHKHVPRCKGDTVYPCDICNRAFNRTDSLEVHRKMHDNRTPKLPTIENLDNIEDHYFQIDQDENIVFSDHSEDNSDIEDCFEPQVEVTESMEEIKEVSNIGHLDDESNISETSIVVEAEDNDSSADKGAEIEGDELDDKAEVKKEAIDEVEEIEDDNNDNDVVEMITEVADDESADSTDSEYLPKKMPSPKQKRGRGRPRKNPNAPPKPPKIKVPGRGEGPSPDERYQKGAERRGIRGIPCPACNEMFNTISQLDKHARYRHEGLKVHNCKVCHKDFHRAKPPEEAHDLSFGGQAFPLYDVHEELQPERPSAPAPEKAFSRADHLVKHKASKHGIGDKIMGDKKYECPLCHKGFTTEKYRDIHVNGHNGQKEYQCKVCEKTFLSKSHLTEHMKFHNEHSKKFLCSECGQRFIRNDYLVIHMRRHRGEKPFKCKYCGKGLNVVSNIRRLQPVHKQENPDDPPPITIPLPKPVVPENVMLNALHANALHANAFHAQLAVAQLHLTRE